MYGTSHFDNSGYNYSIFKYHKKNLRTSAFLCGKIFLNFLNLFHFYFRRDQPVNDRCYHT